jgi:hypothetical protein
MWQLHHIPLIHDPGLKSGVRFEIHVAIARRSLESALLQNRSSTGQCRNMKNTQRKSHATSSILLFFIFILEPHFCGVLHRQF